MRKSSRLFRLLGSAALLISMLAATITPAMAQQDSPDGPSMDYPFQNAPPSFAWGANSVFYPWVANDDNFGLGDADTSISVQNLQDRDGQIWIYVGNGDNTWSLATTAALSAYASKTFTAQQLGIDPGEGAPVVVRGYTTGTTDITAPVLETEVLLFVPAGVENAGDDIYACVANIHEGGAITGEPYPFMAAVDFTWDGNNYVAGDWVEWADQAELQAILNSVNAGNAGEMINPFGGINRDGDCLDATTVVTGETVMYWNSLAIGGVAKMAVAGESLPYTTSADVAVSGYNALNGAEVIRFNEWYLPIVQTNCGPGGCWDSMIRVANLADFNSGVTVRFFPADDGSGSLQTGFQVQASVNGGATWEMNLGDYVPDGWVGSAHIYSDGQIFAMVDRYKVGYSMWVTNTGSAANFENVAQVPTHNNVSGRYALFAPHVLIDWFGWNTGINVANLYDGDNHISIQYFNMLGNATQVLSQRLAAHGMTYFYDPSVAAQNNSAQDVTTDPNAGVVGSAIIWSDHPVAAAVDATKYPETDPRGGADLFQATSYNATQNVFTWQAVPLVQKGNPADGMGATSGINIMNPNPQAATANVYFVNPSGFNAQNFGVSSVTIPGFANGFVYLMSQHNVPNGFVGAAQVISNVPVAVVSANVDYQVDGDGSAIFNAFNPCGLYRTPDLAPWQCYFDDPFDVTGRSVTKYFVDEDNQPINGVEFYIINDNPDFPYQRNGITANDGSAFWTNVPVGNYELHVTDVPAGYQMPGNPADVFTLNQGDDWVETNELLWNQGINKTVVVAGSLDDDDAVDDDTVTLEGVNISVYHNVGTTDDNSAVAGELVYTGLTDEDGFVTSRLAPGNYILCTWDEDGEAVTPNGETVNPDLIATGGFGDLDSFCELFTVVADEYEDLINEVDITEGVLNVFVTDAEVTDTGAVLAQYEMGVAGVEVCLYDDSMTLIDCEDTDANGFVEFPDLPEGDYEMTVQADGLIVVAVDGGEYTVSNEDFDEDGASVTPAIVTFNYNPTDDLAQDGWVDDVDDGDVVGTVGLTIFVEESTAQLVQKTVTLDGLAVEASVTITTIDGEIINIVNDGAITASGDPLTATVDTGVDGIVQFVVEPGTYDICSTVIVDTDGTGLNNFPYTICDPDYLVEETYELYDLPNEHETGTITKNVLVLDSCPEVVVDPLVDCTFVAPVDDTGITVTAETTAVTDSALFTGTYATVGGSVTLTLPVSADVGDYMIESDIFGDVDGETVTIVAGANADLDNHHLVGQLDVGWDGTFPTGLTYPDDATYCLYAEGDAPVAGNELGCVTIPAVSPYAGDAGIYFTNVPTGSYFITWDEGSWGSGQTPNSGAYDPYVDLTFDDDLVDVAGADGYGTLIPGQTFDLIFTSDGSLASGYVAELTVTTEPGAQVQLAAGDCNGAPGAPGAEAVLVGGDGGVFFDGLDAGATYCIQVFDWVGTFVIQATVGPLGSGQNTETVDIAGLGFGVLSVSNFINCADGSTPVGAGPGTDWDFYDLNDAGPGTPPFGGLAANELGDDSVCDPAFLVTGSAAAVYTDNTVVTLVGLPQDVDDSGQAHFLLPVGNYGVGSQYFTDDGIEQYWYTQNTAWSVTATVPVVDGATTTLEWLLRLFAINPSP